MRLIGTKEEPYAAGDLILRTYTYEVSYESKQFTKEISSSIVVVSPWDKDHTLSIPIYAKDFRRIRATPSFLRIDSQEPSPKSTHGEAILFVAVNTVELKNGLTLQAEADSPLIVEPKTEFQSDRFLAFSVRLRPGEKAAEGKYSITIRSASGEEPIVIPVSVNTPKGGGA